MAKPKQKNRADQDRSTLLLQQAEAEARAHLPRPHGKPAPWREETITIVSATGERRNGVAMGRTAPFDPDKEAVRFKRKDLLKPFPLNTDTLLRESWKNRVPVAWAEHGYLSHLALVLLAVCKLRDLTPEEQIIVVHNAAILRMALRYPEIRETVESERGKRGSELQQAKYEQAREFSRTVATNEWADDKTTPPRTVAKYIRDMIDLNAVGLNKKPTIEQIRAWIIDLAPPESKKPGRRRK